MLTTPDRRRLRAALLRDAKAYLLPRLVLHQRAAVEAELERALGYLTAARNLARRLKYSHDDADLVELESYVGYWQAVTTWDPTRAACFSTWAFSRILGHAKEELRRQDYLTRYQRAEVDAACAAGETETLPNAYLRPLGLDAMLFGTDVDDPLWFSEVFCDPEPSPEAQVCAAALWETLAALPERERTVLVLVYAEEARWQDAGVALGVSESRAQQLGGRGREMLREAVAAWA